MSTRQFCFKNYPSHPYFCWFMASIIILQGQWKFAVNSRTFLVRWWKPCYILTVRGKKTGWCARVSWVQLIEFVVIRSSRSLYSPDLWRVWTWNVWQRTYFPPETKKVRVSKCVSVNNGDETGRISAFSDSMKNVNKTWCFILDLGTVEDEINRATG